MHNSAIYWCSVFDLFFRMSVAITKCLLVLCLICAAAAFPAYLKRTDLSQAGACRYSLDMAVECHDRATYVYDTSPYGAQYHNCPYTVCCVEKALNMTDMYQTFRDMLLLALQETCPMDIAERVSAHLATLRKWSRRISRGMALNSQISRDFQNILLQSLEIFFLSLKKRKLLYRFLLCCKWSGNWRSTGLIVLETTENHWLPEEVK